MSKRKIMVIVGLLIVAWLWVVNSSDEKIVYTGAESIDEILQQSGYAVNL